MNGIRLVVEIDGKSYWHVDDLARAWDRHVPNCDTCSTVTFSEQLESFTRAGIVVDDDGCLVDQSESAMRAMRWENGPDAYRWLPS